MIRLDLTLGSAAHMARGPAAPPPFDPAALFAGTAGALFDATDPATLFQDAVGSEPVTADGQEVRRMLDLSGNGHHATNADPGALAPVFRTDGARSWIEMPTGREFLAFDGAALAAAAPMEMMAAFTLIGADSYGTILAAEGGASGPQLVSHQNGLFHYVAPSNTAVTTPAGSHADGIPYVTGLHCEGTRLVASMEGAEVAEATRGTGWGASPGARVGWNGNGAVHGEIRFHGGLSISRALGAAERAGAGRWLAARAGGAYGPARSAFFPAAYLGDSTVGAYGGAQPLSTFVPTARAEHDLARAADTASGQLSAWAGAGLDKASLGWAVIQVGLNDIKAPGATAAGVTAEIQALVDAVAAGAPQAAVLVAQMTPAYGYWLSESPAEAEAIQALWAEVNAAIAGAGPAPVTGVAGRVTAHVAQLGDGTGRLAAAYDIGDAIHPNDAGRQVMADAWVAALAAAGVTA